MSAAVIALSLALAFTFSLLAGVVAGVLAHADHASLPAALQRAATAFAGTLGLAVVVLVAVGVL